MSVQESTLAATCAEAASEQGGTVNLLWTGGWDSTFRLLMLVCVEQRHVQPHYVIDVGRRSSLNELHTMGKIRARLAREFPEAGERIRPLQIVSICDIDHDMRFTEAFRRLSKTYGLGRQYDWLARFAAQFGVADLELSVNAYSARLQFLNEFASRDGTGCWRLQHCPDEDVLMLFSHYRLPILGVSKQEMTERAKEHGFDEILNMSWFCFSPRRNLPCGMCSACRYAFHEQMAHRFNTAAKIRYYLSPLIPAIGAVKNVLRSIRRRLGLKVRADDPARSTKWAVKSNDPQ